MQIIAVLRQYNSIWNLVRHKTLHRTVWKLRKTQILQSLLYWNLTSRLFPYQPPRKSRARLRRRYKEVVVVTGRLMKEENTEVYNSSSLFPVPVQPIYGYPRSVAFSYQTCWESHSKMLLGAQNEDWSWANHMGDSHTCKINVILHNWSTW